MRFHLHLHPFPASFYITHNNQVGDMIQSSVDKFVRDIILKSQANTEVDNADKNIKSKKTSKTIGINHVIQSLEQSGAVHMCEEVKEFVALVETEKVFVLHVQSSRYRSKQTIVFNR
jgi:hypothetical protein